MINVNNIKHDSGNQYQTQFRETILDMIQVNNRRRNSGKEYQT